MSDMTYSQAMQRLEAILAQLEEGNKSVDELSDLVKEAAELVKLCRVKLRKTESDIQTAVEGA
jgi:exodeoxyribonuclease VII small subunit